MANSKDSQRGRKAASTESRDNERARRIAELKQAVASGSYRVKSRELACDLLESLLNP